MKIVNSKDSVTGKKIWDNLRVENGIDGAPFGHIGLKGNKNGMFNKTHTDKVKENQSKRMLGKNKNKTYEEIYGTILAQKIKNDRKNSASGKDNAGKKNPRALRIKAISPEGEEFIIEGGVDQFCKDHKLGNCRVRDAYLHNKPHYLGWKFILLSKVHSDG